MLETINRWS